MVDERPSGGKHAECKRLIEACTHILGRHGGRHCSCGNLWPCPSAAARRADREKLREAKEKLAEERSRRHALQDICERHGLRAEKAEAECERLRAELSEAIVNGPRQFNEGHQTGRDQAEEAAREEIERLKAERDEAEAVLETLRCDLASAVEGGLGVITADPIKAIRERGVSLMAQLDVAEAERDEARRLLAEAAREINCAGPVAHRIRVLKRESIDLRDKIKSERDALAEENRKLRGGEAPNKTLDKRKRLR